MSGALFNERVVAIQPSLVRATGSVTRAAIVQQIHYHAQVGHECEQRGGHCWIVRTYGELGEELGLTAEAVRRAVVRLQCDRLLATCQPEGYQRRKWYRVLYDHPALSDSSKWRERQQESALTPRRNGGSAITSSSQSGRERPKEQWQIDRDAERESAAARRQAVEKEFARNERLAQQQAEELEANGGAAPPPSNLRDRLRRVS